MIHYAQRYIKITIETFRLLRKVSGTKQTNSVIEMQRIRDQNILFLLFLLQVTFQAPWSSVDGKNPSGLAHESTGLRGAPSSSPLASRLSFGSFSESLLKTFNSESVGSPNFEYVATAVAGKPLKLTESASFVVAGGLLAGKTDSYNTGFGILPLPDELVEVGLEHAEVLA